MHNFFPIKLIHSRERKLQALTFCVFSMYRKIFILSHNCEDHQSINSHMQRTFSYLLSASVLSGNTELRISKPLKNSSYMENSCQYKQPEMRKVKLTLGEEKNIQKLHVCFQWGKTLEYVCKFLKQEQDAT